MKSALVKNYSAVCQVVHAKFSTLAAKHQTALLFGVGALLLSGGLIDVSNAQGSTGPTTTPPGTSTPGSVLNIDETSLIRAGCALLNFMEGSFGALLMVVSGIGAIMAAAVGKYSAAMSLLVVGCGSFILRALITVFFPGFTGSLCSSVGYGPKGVGK